MLLLLMKMFHTWYIHNLVVAIREKNVSFALAFFKHLLICILVECYALMASGRGKAGYVCV